MILGVVFRRITFYLCQYNKNVNDTTFALLIDSFPKVICFLFNKIYEEKTHYQLHNGKYRTCKTRYEKPDERVVS